MANKEVRFSTVIDTSSFDQAINKMQKKLQELTYTSDRSSSILGIKQDAYRAGAGSAPTMNDQARSDRDQLNTRKQMIGFIKEEVKEAEKLRKLLNEQLEAKNKMTKGSKEYEESLKNIAKYSGEIEAKQKNISNLSAASRRAGYQGEGGFGGILERGAEQFRIGKMQGGFAYGVGRGLGGIAGGVADFARFNPLGMASGILGAAGSAAVIGSEIYRDYSRLPGDTALATGAATTGFARPATNLMQGDFLSNFVNRGKLSQASKIAKEETDASIAADRLKLGGLAATAGAGLAGAASGIGLIPGLGVAGASVLGIAMNENLRTRALGNLGFSGYADKYQSMKAQEQASRQQQILEGLKAQDPILQQVLPLYQQETMANLPMQRKIGINNQDMDMLLGNANAQGLTSEALRNQMSQISDAQGGSQTARGGALFASQIERSRGLSNAGQVLGRLSYMGGGDQIQSEEMMTKIFAQAFSKGLDNSQFREEQNKYVQTVAQIVERSGAYSQEGMQRVSESFAGILGGDKSMRGIDMARSAYDAAQQMSVEGGAGQVLRMSQYRGQPGLEGASMKTIAMADQATIEELQSGNFDFLLGGKEGREAAIKAKRFGMTKTKAGESALNALDFSQTGTEEFQGNLKTFITEQGMFDQNAAQMVKRFGEKGAVAYAKSLRGETLTEEERSLMSQSESREDILGTQSGQYKGDQMLEGQAAIQEQNRALFQSFGSQLDVTKKDISEFGKGLLKIVSDVQESIKRGDFQTAREQAQSFNLGGSGINNVAPKVD